MRDSGGGRNPTATIKVVILLAWISVHDHVDGGKLRELAKEIGCSKKEALGILVSLWLWGLKNADRTGKLRSCDKGDVAEEVANGVSTGLAPESIVDNLIDQHWIDEEADGSLYLHDWDVWQEQWYKFLSTKEYDAERKRKERARKKIESSGTSSDCPVDCHTDSPPDSPADKVKEEQSDGKPEEKSPKYPFEEIISYLNEKANTRYQWTSKATQRHIQARFKEKYTLQDFYAVIDHKVSEWKDDKKMQQFIRPETLFGTKFEGYLNQAPRMEMQKEPESGTDGNPFDMWKE